MLDSNESAGKQWLYAGGVMAASVGAVWYFNRGSEAHGEAKPLIESWWNNRGNRQQLRLEAAQTKREARGAARELAAVNKQVAAGVTSSKIASPEARAVFNQRTPFADISQARNAVKELSEMSPMDVRQLAGSSQVQRYAKALSGSKWMDSSEHMDRIAQRSLTPDFGVNNYGKEIFADEAKQMRKSFGKSVNKSGLSGIEKKILKAMVRRL